MPVNSLCNLLEFQLANNCVIFVIVCVLKELNRFSWWHVTDVYTVKEGQTIYGKDHWKKETEEGYREKIQKARGKEIETENQK